MITACNNCRTSSENLLDKPTGKLYCIGCGAEIPISDGMRNLLAKKNMFMPASKPQGYAQPQYLPQQYPSPTNQPFVNQVPYKQINAQNVPTVRPGQNNQSKALEDAKRRLAKIHQITGIEPQLQDSNLRQVGSKAPKISKEEAFQRKQELMASLANDDQIAVSRATDRRGVSAREVFSDAGLNIDQLSDALIGEE